MSTRSYCSSPAGVLGLSVVALTLVLTGCDASTPPSSGAPQSTSVPSAAASPPSPDPVTPTPTPTATPTPTPTPTPRLISYGTKDAPGFEIKSEADASKLRGAPPAFKKFIATTARKVRAESDCEDGYVGVSVDRLRTDGYASGGVNDCGGYAALWAIVKGEWKEVSGTQDIWPCSDLRRYKIPSDVAGDSCYDEELSKVSKYEQD